MTGEALIIRPCVRADVPDIAHLQPDGWECFLKAPRMMLGENIEWNPRSLFSRIGGWYG